MPVKDIIAYLEKQKENLKSADSIPSDCTSDAKSEDRWHKITDSLPDNGRLVLANDCLGNTLLARYDGEGNWEVSVYDNEDYYCRNTITKWCEIPSEKQKEQKIPITGNDFGWIDELKHDLEHPEELDQKVDDVLKQRKGIRALEQKPAEWKPQPESLEALMYAIEGEWDKIKPTSYLSRRLEDLYEGLVNTFNVDESLLAELPKTAYSAKDIEELRVLKDKIEASMESPVDKPAEWSEEDEKTLISVIRGELELSEIRKEYFINRLKSLRPVKQEWSEEDEASYDAFICEVVNGKMNPTLEQVKWLRNLRDRLKSLRPQPKVGWSEEDRDKVAQYLHDRDGGMLWSKATEITSDILDILRPQPHWKPSEEQMEALADAIFFDKTVFRRKKLVSLLEDLKKLK